MEFLKWFGQVVVVVLGWYVVNSLTVRRDIEKARRELTADAADAVFSRINHLLQLALSYHCEAHSSTNAFSIKMILQDIGQQVDSLMAVCQDRKLVLTNQRKIAQLRRAVTGHHFDDEHYHPLNQNDELLQEIASAAMDAKISIIQLKYQQFPLEMP